MKIVRTLSRIFLKYLDHLVGHSDTPIEVIYTPAIPQMQHNITISNSKAFSRNDLAISNAKPARFDLCILTPDFYRRFASHTSLKGSLEAEILSGKAEENRAAQVSNSEAFCALLLSSANRCFTNTSQTRTQCLVDHFQWLLVYFTRTSPRRGFYPTPGNPHLRTQAKGKKEPATVSLSVLGLSERMGCLPSFLDLYVLSCCSQRDQAAYRRALMRVFLSYRIAFGDERLLGAYEVTLKASFAAIAGRMVWVRWLSRETVLDIRTFGSLLVPLACLLITVWSMSRKTARIVTPYLKWDSPYS